MQRGGEIRGISVNAYVVIWLRVAHSVGVVVVEVRSRCCAWFDNNTYRLPRLHQPWPEIRSCVEVSIFAAVEEVLTDSSTVCEPHV
jgi:hypothetical protein